MFSPNTAAKESFIGVIPTAFLASAGEQLRDIANARASSPITLLSGALPIRYPFQTERRGDNPAAEGVGADTPCKAQGEGARVGKGAQGRLRFLPVVARPVWSRGFRRLAPPPARSTFA